VKTTYFFPVMWVSKGRTKSFRRRRIKRSTLIIVVLVVNACLYISAGVFNKLPGKALYSPEDHRAEKFLLQVPRNFIMIEPYHGLGNRLRAYGSAAALARKTGKTLIVIWIADPHVNATMQDLFDTTNITVVDYPVAPAVSRVFPETLYYDYNTDGRKDEILRDSASLPIYVRSAYVLQSETSVSEADISKELLSLTLSREVLEHVQILEAKMVKRADLIGVHIRMNTDITKDVPGIQNIKKNSPASAAHMGAVKSERGRCHYNGFIPHMEKVLEKNPLASFFVASDSSCAISSMISKFPDTVISTDLHKLAMCEGSISRGKNCLQISLSEFWVLGRSVSYLVLSEWSSASELILRLGAHKIPHESGCVPKQRSVFGFLG
jgi:hypothetical protein